MHDVTFFSEPELHSAREHRLLPVGDPHRRAPGRRVVVPSQATRDELVRLLDADPEHIDVARHGVDTTTFRPPTEAETPPGQRPARPARPAATSRSSASSSGARTSRTWSAAGSRRSTGLPEPPALVLAGSSGWDDGVDQAVTEVPPHLKIVRTGFMRPADLPGLLGGAMVVAYPSKAEGFGLPVLEAMACGAAVLTARRLSLPEVGGDAVAYTEPDADSIAEALRDADRRRGAAQAALRVGAWSAPRSSPGRPRRRRTWPTYARAAGGVDLVR